MADRYPRTDAFFPQTGTTSEKTAFLLDLLKLPSDYPNASLTELSGGITNAVYLLEVPPTRHVVRVYGHNTDRIINRRDEIIHILQINLMSINATFGNGLIVDYKEGRATEPPMLADPVISDKVALALAKLHRVTLSSEKHQNELFLKIDQFLGGLDPTRDDVNIPEYSEKVAKLKALLESELADAPIVLAHNDLLAANVIWDSETQTVHVIDYEYCAWTWPQFDVANHFFEWVGYELELARFPSIEQQKRFLRVYLEALEGKKPDEGTIDQWQRQVSLCVPASNLFWGSWGFFQAQNSKVDFPYLEYARLRTMIAGLSLPLPAGHELLGAALLRV
jgi:ethanolamine kinase